MVRMRGRLLAAGVMTTAFAVPAAALAASKHDTITGTAKTECGKPVSSFKVGAYGFDGKVNVNPGGLPFLGSASGHSGRYSLQTKDSVHQRTPVNALVRSVVATAAVKAGGERYTLTLDPADHKPNGTAKGDFSGRSGAGLKRNFVLRTSGLKPGFTAYRSLATEGDDSAAGAFYGGNLTLALGFYPAAGQTVTATLTPTTKLIDGCASHTVTRTANPAALHSSYIYLHSIPLAGYILSVKLNGAPLPLHPNGQSGQNTTMPVAFPPSDTQLSGETPVMVDAG
jgi:hypothetical protein